MSRTFSEAGCEIGSSGPSADRQSAAPEPYLRDQAGPASDGWDYWAIRAGLVGGVVIAAALVRPLGLPVVPSAGIGFAAGLLVLLAELRLRRAALSGLLGAVLGTLAGALLALLITLVLSRIALTDPSRSLLEALALVTLAYLGLVVGAKRGAGLFATALAGPAAVEPQQAPAQKLLDTSVLIDGRIADICAAHFLDGTLIVPQFVLRELQMVADSADTLKRQRGRRGLEVLERMRKMPQVTVQVLDDITQSAEVDHKLVELARQRGAKIVTNDFNLNKVATVQGVAVLNVNQLANALKPVVLPGEAMHVLILREGKEANQGVAYLDDGTMVVVDGARRLIGRSIDVIVTSVHQTTAGKMIFGRLDDRSEPPAPSYRQAAAGAGPEGPSRPPDPLGGRAPRHVVPEAD